MSVSGWDPQTHTTEQWDRPPRPSELLNPADAEQYRWVMHQRQHQRRENQEAGPDVNNPEAARLALSLLGPSGLWAIKTSIWVSPSPIIAYGMYLLNTHVSPYIYHVQKRENSFTFSFHI